MWGGWEAGRLESQDAGMLEGRNAGMLESQECLGVQMNIENGKLKI
jgi:hypothetical protein